MNTDQHGLFQQKDAKIAKMKVLAFADFAILVLKNIHEGRGGL